MPSHTIEEHATANGTKASRSYRILEGLVQSGKATKSVAYEPAPVHRVFKRSIGKIRVTRYTY